MDLLKIVGNEARLSSDLLRLLDALAGKVGSLQKALEMIQQHFSVGNPVQEVAQLLGQLGLNVAAVANLYAKYQDKLGFLQGSLSDVIGRKENWPLKVSAAVPAGGGGLIGLQVSAGAEAAIECDTSSIFDGAIALTDDQAAIMATVTGRLEGQINHSGKLQVFSSQAAFSANAQAAISNVFLHQKSDRTLTALLSDVTDFKLPGMIHSAADLRATHGGGVLTKPLQYVRIAGRGFVQIAGSLSWQQGLLSTSFTASPWAPDSLVNLGISAQASFHFSRLLQGDFDVIVCDSPDDTDRVRVHLAKSKTSERELGFKIGAEVSVEGLDTIAKGVMSRIVPKVNKLTDLLEKNLDKYGDLRKLFESKLGDTLDHLFAQQNVTNQIEAWLAEIGASLDLRDTLKQVAKEAALKITADDIDNINQQIKPVVDAIKDLIRKYRDALEKLNGIIEKAANLKIGIEFSREQRLMEEEEVALTVDIDPHAQKDIFRRMLIGEFDTAILSHESDPSSGVVVVGGSLVRKGSLSITTDLNVTVAGFKLGTTTILSQQWDAEVSSNGDILIGVQSDFKAIHHSWRATRTCAFLADTRVIANVGGALPDLIGTTQLSLELAYDHPDPKIKDIEALESLLQRLGVASGPATLAKDLALAIGGDKSFGEIQASTMLSMGNNGLQGILDTPNDRAMLTFTENLLEFYLHLGIYHVRDKDHLPILLWDSVRIAADTQQPSLQPLTYRDKHGVASPPFDHGEQVLLFNNSKRIRSFGRLLAGLAAFRKKLIGVTADDALSIIRNAQISLMKSVSDLIADSSDVNYALFATLLNLADSQNKMDPYAVIRRMTDDRVFVYG